MCAQALEVLCDVRMRARGVFFLMKFLVQDCVAHKLCVYGPKEQAGAMCQAVVEKSGCDGVGGHPSFDVIKHDEKNIEHNGSGVICGTSGSSVQDDGNL